jgi:Skp family chaperone for outer membrane proteins
MKNFLKLSLALALLASVANIKAGDTLDKVRTVNLQALILESEAGKEVVGELQRVRAQLENELKSLSMEIQRIDDEIKKLRTDLASKKAVASTATVADTERKVRDLEYKKGELQAKGQRIVQDGQNDMQMKEMELMQPLFNEFAAVVAQYAKEKDLYMVIDESSGRVLYKKDGLDATQDVMKMANKKHEQKVTMAKNKPASTPKAPSTKVA